MAWLLAGCAAPAIQPAQGEGRFSFALWGDMPYKRNGDDPGLKATIDSLNAADIAFSIHDGDIKDGGSRCDDAVYTDALALFNRLKAPAFYTPGDNEWTDCHRLSNGGYNNLERLDHLRRVMFGQPTSLGERTMPVIQQAAPYVENLRFEKGGVVFATFNIPGSNNNRVADAQECSFKSARGPAECEADNAEYEARDQANIRWLHEAFAVARQQGARGVVTVFQADPGFDLPETTEVDESRSPIYTGYRRFMDALVAETQAFRGQVLLVHGDMHFYKVDMPIYLGRRQLTHLTRIETFGSPSLHWVKVTIDPSLPTLFDIEPVIVY
ncbi:hypothetical protein AACH06_14335 [Ideonella sp. DXS29W]|uniref:Calcineurin-like phosphoesterase domain-containing protein n=1 Tax=Ideonella lacteola TaxID=2984193 RepID=A0ABU9BPV9_9BURK